MGLCSTAVSRCFCLLSISVLLGACSSQGPDMIFFGGPVLTVNSQNEVASALAIENGLIVAVGSDSDILALQADHTEVIDLQGKTLMPGFIGAHEHPTLTAVFAGATDLSGFTHKNNRQVWEALRTAVATADAGDWIYAGGLDPILTRDLKMPTRKFLDEIAPQNPLVIVSQTLHSFWANTAAFAAAGINKHTPDPGPGAYYERDSSGELTGFVAESLAATPLLKTLKSPWQLLDRYEAALDQLQANGFTSVASLGHNVPPLMARFASSKGFQPRIRQFFYLVEDELNYLPDSPDTDNAYFRVLGVKLWHDGSPYTGSMYTASPYLDSALNNTLGIPAGSHGAPMFSTTALQEKVRTYSDAGWQIAIHSQGDASLREVTLSLDAVGELPGELPVVRIEHAVELPIDQIPALAKQNTTVSFHINHILYYGDALQQSIIGERMAQNVLPVQTAFAQGLQPTLHADSPMFPAQPFSLMQTAVTRATSSGKRLNPDEAITIEQAVRAMTINGARQLRIADEAGSLEAGKWADLLIVNRNPYDTPIHEIDRIKVLAVLLNGRVTFGTL
ncbi:N-substituted formamide deformylase [Halioglobus japonicus]|nr:N-substituted formamide deformylase [Halioglobus japonicus]